MCTLRPIPVIAALVLATTVAACAHRPSVKPGLAVAGTALAVAGTALAISSLTESGKDSDGDGRDEFPDHELSCTLLISNCFLGTVLGGSIATGGVTLVMLSLVNNEPPTPLTPIASVGSFDPATNDHVLPLLYTNSQTLQFAKQARRHAEGGRCDLARASAMQVKARDPSYFEAMIAHRTLAPC